MSEYLTTKELAALLRIKERKVYDLAASGRLPCSRATGKLLFPRRSVEAWIARNSSGSALLDGPGSGAMLPSAGPSSAVRPDLFLGSHDPLLEWALRESQCEIATYFDSSSDGLDRFVAGAGIATGLHLFDAASETWNVPVVRARCAAMPVVLVEWARRQRGLILSPRLQGRVASIAELAGLRLAVRQPGAGTQALFEILRTQAGLDSDAFEAIGPARSEVDAALAVLEDKADATFGLAALAAQYRLDFVPLIEERFDLLIERRAWFEPAMQTFLDFCRSDALAGRAAELRGYDVGALARVRYNAPVPG